LFEGGHHRFFKELIGSWLHEMGAHILDLPFWALDPGPPHAVSASGGRFVMTDMTTIPDTMDVVFEYPDFIMTWSNQCASSHARTMNGVQKRLLISFHGANGTLLADYGSLELLDDKGRLKDVPLPEPSIPPSPGHQREFLDCVRSRAQCSCNVEYHFPIHVAMNLGHIALDVGRKVQWDAQNNQIVDDPEANRLAAPDYRAPWRLPL
jgi:predicted dehydrogenase